MRKLLICAWVFLSTHQTMFAQEAASDTLYLIDGTSLTGKVLNPSSTSTIRIKNDGGAILYVKKERIESIIFSNPDFIGEQEKIVQPPEFEDEKVAFSIRMGMGLPYGDFSRANNATSGFASTGWSAEAGLWVKIIEDVYWNNKVSYTRNNLKKEAFEGVQGQSLGVNFVSGIYKPWTGWHFQTGIGYQYHFDEKLTFLFEGVFGFSRFTSPSIILFTDQLLEFRLEEAKGAGFNSTLGASIKYMDKYTFSLNILSSNPIFVFSGTQSTTVVQPVRLISLSLGAHFFSKSKL